MMVGFDMGSSAERVWSTNVGDELIQLGPNSRSFDVTDMLAGATTFEIFLEADVNLYYFNMNWDDISLEVCDGPTSRNGGGMSDPHVSFKQHFVLWHCIILILSHLYDI